MCRIALLFLVAIGAFAAAEASRVRAAGVRLGPEPAVVIRLRKGALDKFFASVSSLGARHAGKVPIPDVKATVSGVDIQTKNFRLNHFAEPIIKYTFIPNNKINGTIEFPSVGVEGPFEACRRTLIKTQKDGGIIIFNATKIQVHFQTSLGEFENGIPKIDTFECQSFLGPSNLRVRNVKENFAVEVLGLAASTFRKVYDSQVCPTVKRLVGNQINRLLAKIPNVLEVNKKFAFKYQVKPQVGADYVQVGLHGKCLTEHVSSFVPAKFVEQPSEDATVAIFISDAPFNDFAYQAFINQKLEFTVDKQCHPLIYSLVALKCDPQKEACLGNVAPSLAQRYGADADVEAVFKANKAPEVEFLQDRAVFRASLAAELSVTPINGSETFPEATAVIDIAGNLKIKIHESAIYANVAIDDVVVHINEERNKKYEDKIKETVRQVVQESINSGLLHKGLPLKLPFGIGVTDPLIKFSPHTLQAHTGFEYKAQTSSEESHGKPQPGRPQGGRPW